MINEFLLSDESINTHGFVVCTTGGGLDRFSSNPIMLYMHDENQAIGQWQDIRIEGSKIFGTPIFDQDDELGAKVARKVERGFLRMASVGIVPLKAELRSIPNCSEQILHVTQWELKEVSIVPFGSNKNALKMYDSSNTEINLTDKTKLLELCDSSAKTNTNMIKLFTTLKLSASASEAEILTAVELLLADNAALKAKISAIDAAQAEARLAESATLINTAIKDGRINASAKEAYVALFAVDHTSAKLALEAISKPSNIADQLAKSTTHNLSDLTWDEIDQKNKLSELRDSDFESFKVKFKQKYSREYSAK